MTIWAGVVAGAAILLLVVLDHRKPVRRRRVAPRALVPGRGPVAREVEHLPTRPYRRPPLWRRLLSLGGLGVMGFVLGCLLAIATAVVLMGLFQLVQGITK